MLDRVLAVRACDIAGLDRHELSCLLHIPKPKSIGLLAVMYIGRGDLDPSSEDPEPTDAEDVSYLVSSLELSFPSVRMAINQMSGKTPVAQYLRDGIVKLDMWNGWDWIVNP